MKWEDRKISKREEAAVLKRYRQQRLPDPWTSRVDFLFRNRNTITMPEVLLALEIPLNQQNELTKKRIADLVAKSMRNHYPLVWSRVTVAE